MISALIKKSTECLDGTDTNAGINIGSIPIKSMPFQCVSLFHQTADLSSSPLLCFVLFAAAATWLSGAKADTHTRALAGLRWVKARWLRKKWSIVWSYFTAVKGNIASHCGGRPFTTVTIAPLYTNAWKALFYFTSKKHRYQLTGPAFNWYQNNPTFSPKISHP